MCALPLRCFTEGSHRHATTSPVDVATIASTWRGFAPTTPNLGPHCPATTSPSRWMSGSPHLVGLCPDAALPLSNGAPSASLHLNVLLGRLVAGLGGASPRLRLVFGIGGASPRLRFAGGHFACVDTTFGLQDAQSGPPEAWVGAPGGLIFDPGGPPRGVPGRPRAPPETSRFKGDRWWSVYTSQQGPSA